MKIDPSKIPPGGLKVIEEISPSLEDLETGLVKFKGPIRVEADIFKITNAVTAEIVLAGSISMSCGRCLVGFMISLQKKLRLSYPLEKEEATIDFGPEIREEIILDYPLKPLCRPDCRGLCPKCGKNLNEGNCNCN